MFHTPQRSLDEHGLPTESPHIAQYFDAYSIPSRLHGEHRGLGSQESHKDETNGSVDFRLSQAADNIKMHSEYRAPASFMKQALAASTHKSAHKSSVKKPHRRSVKENINGLSAERISSTILTQNSPLAASPSLAAPDARESPFKLKPFEATSSTSGMEL